MDKLKLEQCQEIIEKILREYAAIPYAFYDNLKQELIISENHRHYLLITSGWENDDIRVHGCVVHLEIINDKIWIHRDGTEDGLADELVNNGIPKSQIVLGFHPPEIRTYTDFAVS